MSETEETDKVPENKSYDDSDEALIGEAFVLPESVPMTEGSPCSSDYIEECYEEIEGEEWGLAGMEEAVHASVQGEERLVEEEELPGLLEDRISLDSEYLKRVLGTPLTFGLLDIAMKRPTDPIHYLAHFLIKWRWNGLNKDEYEKQTRLLTEERNARIERERNREKQEMLRREQDEEQRRRVEKEESSTESSSDERELYGENAEEYYGPVQADVAI